MLIREDKKWLNEQGGRDERHVMYDLDNRAYVWMFNPELPFGQEKVYLPSAFMVIK